MGLAMAVRLRPPSAARPPTPAPPLALIPARPRRAAPQVERHRSAIEQKERVADEIRKNIELAKEETVRANLRNSAQFLAQFSDALCLPLRRQTPWRSACRSSSR